MRPQFRVILNVDTARSFGRGLLTGISRYVRLGANWHIYRQPPRYIKTLDPNQEAARIRQWRPQGAILWAPEGAERLLSLKIPLIASPNLVTSEHLKQRLEAFPRINADCEAIGTMAADYLLEKGFRFFAFCGFDAVPWSLRRRTAFVQRIELAGFGVFVFQSPKTQESISWQQEIENIAEWIGGLPKPLAVMACNDDRGFDVLEACHRIDCMIPEEVAVVGVDNEEESCSVFNPPLSSIHLNAAAAGYQAAETLEAMMCGQETTPENANISVAPMYVVTRRSTEVTAIEDRIVAEAVHFIQQQIFKPIQVEDVVQKVVVSRRNLEQRFQKNLSRSVFAQIRKVKTAKVAEMLLRTQMSVNEIAHRFGYPDAHNLSRFFQKETGMSPLAYRQKHRL